MSVHDSLFDEANRQWDIGNIKQAFVLFKQADQQGSRNAANSIGYFFDHGIGIKKDQNKALFWYKKAARLNDVTAYANIGTMYRDRNNPRLAGYWFLKALHNGDDDAALELGKLYLSKGNIKASYYLRLLSKSKRCAESSREEAAALLKKL